MTFLTSKSLPRRTVLRGIGATLSLPFLEAMVPVLSRARAAGKPVNRFLAFYVPNRWRHSGTSCWSCQG